MKSTLQVSNNRDIRLSKDIYFDAWLYNFMIENNYAYHMNQDLIASPEQIGFMVALEHDEVYMPCSDELFSLMMQAKMSHALMKEYARVWKYVVRLVRGFESKPEARKRIMAFCRVRFRLFIKNHTILPSRVMKRMISLVAAQTGVEDPWRVERHSVNKQAKSILESPALRNALYAAPKSFFCSNNLLQMRTQLNSVELARLMYISAMAESIVAAPPSPLEWPEIFENMQDFIEPFLAILGVDNEIERKTLLFLPDSNGSFVFDIPMLRRLLRMGHNVIVAIKNGVYFNCPNIRDMDEEATLKEFLDDATVILDEAISKNDLLHAVKESRFVIIPDGTRERLNLYRTNVTFARAWKEADIIIAKGQKNVDILVGSSQQFTRDIVGYYMDNEGKYHVKTKARARHIRKFSEADISERADTIIASMREAHKAGKTVMFYSCIIGSIPGQEATAISLVRAFVDSLRQKLDDTYIINPAEQSAHGMDGDDLMYMWEKVQRSGYINVWRFQTVRDIEESFALLGRKVSPAWAGKDSTFSTGCTQEMHIAIGVQRKNPEMQIIGPDKEKFFRRKVYGVGKYFDARIS